MHMYIGMIPHRPLGVNTFQKFEGNFATLHVLDHSDRVSYSEIYRIIHFPVR